MHKSEWNVSVIAPKTERECLEGKITWERNEALLTDINATLQEGHACSGSDWQTERAFSASITGILEQIMHALNKSKLILMSRTLSCAFTNSWFSLHLLFSPVCNFLFNCQVRMSHVMCWHTDLVTVLLKFPAFYENPFWITGYYWILLHGSLEQLILIGQKWHSAVKCCCIMSIKSYNWLLSCKALFLPRL